MSSSIPENHQIDRLLTIMAKLRDPISGCAWDLQQNSASLAAYAIEEAYELEEAIAASDKKAMQDELGDLLLQVVFHAQIAEESGDFSFNDVAYNICEKMIRRHPHIFTDNLTTTSSTDIQKNWEAIKSEERKSKNPEVGLGVVGIKTLTILALTLSATSPLVEPVTKPITHNPARGYCTITTSRKALDWVDRTVSKICFDAP